MQNRGHFQKGKKSPFPQHISSGDAGVLVTCVRGRERRCAHEAIQIFEEISTELGLWPLKTEPAAGTDAEATTVGPDADADAGSGSGSGSDSEPDAKPPTDAAPAKTDDFMDSFMAELAELQGVVKAKTDPNDKRPAARAPTNSYSKFVFIELGMPCLLFVRFPRGIDPVPVATALLRDVAATGRSRTQTMQRILPIQCFGRADPEEVIPLAQKILSPAFHVQDTSDGTPKIHPKSFSVVYNARNCHVFSRTTLLPQLAGFVGPPHRVELKRSEYVIVAEAIKGHFGLAVVKDYYDLKKFNLSELVRVDLPSAGGPAAAKDSKRPRDEVTTEDANPAKKGRPQDVPAIAVAGSDGTPVQVATPDVPQAEAIVNSTEPATAPAEPATAPADPGLTLEEGTA
ncbi:hypothetical protein H696_04215 [Fonticula alba]|uniref:THUMP domain-containing protein n=1 Tax=Fonticula alba TaxID=691883 RepID=A0A058Z3T0_FONAL|nr:hypothetical protein H696_04215 [Fonticula alba]KCV68796.1 hypothetical protein H696_04215 [Fonticula alba]|eukprot:XP_009496367.1 hypothetical protein H696_04215 [Fonticula alba]